MCARQSEPCRVQTRTAGMGRCHSLCGRSGRERQSRLRAPVRAAGPLEYRLRARSTGLASLARRACRPRPAEPTHTRRSAPTADSRAAPRPPSAVLRARRCWPRAVRRAGRWRLLQRILQLRERGLLAGELLRERALALLLGKMGILPPPHFDLRQIALGGEL